MFRVDTNPRYL